MADTFLHGVETIEVASSTGSVSTVKTGVIGLIGTLGTGATNVANTLYLCLSEADDAKFGTDGTVFKSLKAIRKQLPSAVVFVVATGTTTPVVADIEGTDTGGVKTGLKLFDTCRAIYGFNPKIFICPEFSATATIATVLIACADKFRGVAYIDSSESMTYANALTSRGVSGAFNFSKNRAKIFYPGLKDSQNVVVRPSAYCAGLRAKIDLNEGFWFSSSNHEIEGVSGIEIPLSWELNDPDCEVNQLNAIGLVTFINVYGSGIKEWGNRNSAYPTTQDSRTFEAIQRLDDITSEAIEIASLPYIDKPMTKAQIDLVSDMVNTYFNTLISRGALIQGSKCTFDPMKNSTTEMAKGHYVWTKTFMGAVPGERFTFYSTIDTSLLSNLITD